MNLDEEDRSRAQMAYSAPFLSSFSAVRLNHRDSAPAFRRPDLALSKSSNALATIVASSSFSDHSGLLQAAKHAVDSYVRSGMAVGLGSGLASCMAIEYLGRQLRAGVIEDIVGIPTSVASASEAAKAGIPLKQHDECSNIDLAFDDADAIEEETLAAVIGCQDYGVESIIQEKTILKEAGKLVFLAMGKQYKVGVDGSIPVLIKPFNWMETAEEIDDLFLGDAEVWRRSTTGSADPLGGNFPLLTKDGHNVLDLIFTSPIQSLVEVAVSLDQIDGVVDHGVFFRIPCMAILVTDSGLQIVDNSVELSKL